MTFNFLYLIFFFLNKNNINKYFTLFKTFIFKNQYLILTINNLHTNFYKNIVLNNNFIYIQPTHFNFFFNFFFKNYFVTKIKKNFSLKLQSINFLFLETNQYYIWFIQFTKKNSALLKSSFFTSKNIIHLLLAIFFKKDSILLSSWLKITLEQMYYKNHKKFLMFFKIFLFFFLKYLNIFFKIKGLYFKLKGKISLGGSSKKKKFNFNWGSYSFSNKLLKVDYSKSNVKTITGLLGFFLFIFF